MINLFLIENPIIEFRNMFIVLKRLEIKAKKPKHYFKGSKAKA